MFSDECSLSVTFTAAGVCSLLHFFKKSCYLRTEGSKRPNQSKKGWWRIRCSGGKKEEMFPLKRCWCSVCSSVHMEALMQVFYPDCVFSSASRRPNAVSHSVPSLPDGPWPSQPYLHLLAGPASLHRGRLLAGKTHLHSLSVFLIFFLPFYLCSGECWKEPPQSSYV